jgi:hypothetical protein
VIAVTGQKGGSWSKEEWMMAGRRQEWGDDIEIVFFGEVLVGDARLKFLRRCDAGTYVMWPEDFVVGSLPKGER